MSQVVSPTISSPVCQEQLVEAGKLVDRSMETCVKACRSASDDSELLKQVGAAAGVVSQSLSDLLQHVRHYASCGEPIGRYDQATDTIMNVTENIFTSMGDAGEYRLFDVPLIHLTLPTQTGLYIIIIII